MRSERLGRTATDTGRFAVLAIDHVRSFAAAVRPGDPDSMGADELRAAKLRLVEGLGPHAGAVLVDPGFWTGAGAAGPGTQHGAGLVLGIEDGDYEDARSAPRLLPGWDAARAARLGVDAVKISFYFDPDGDTSAAERFAADAAERCAAAEMPLFSEPLALYEDPSDRRRAVLEGVRRFGGLGADVLKLQFPEQPVENPSRQAWAESCEQIDRLSPVPWTVLSEGSDYRLFRDMLGAACRAGASGFVAGRAVWRDAATGRASLESCADRLRELRTIAEDEGVDWRTRSPGDRTAAGGKPTMEDVP